MKDYDIVIVIKELDTNKCEMSNPWVSNRVPYEMKDEDIVFRRDSGEFDYSPSTNSVWLSNNFNHKSIVYTTYISHFLKRIELEKEKGKIPYKFIVIKKPLHQ